MPFAERSVRPKARTTCANSSSEKTVYTANARSLEKLRWVDLAVRSGDELPIFPFFFQLGVDRVGGHRAIAHQIFQIGSGRPAEDEFSGKGGAGTRIHRDF